MEDVLEVYTRPYDPLRPQVCMDETSKQASVSTRQLDNGWLEKTTTFKFEYNYGEIPSDVVLFLGPPIWLTISPCAAARPNARPAIAITSTRSGAMANSV